MTMLDGTDEITELEKISPSRVDGVDRPASGFPILLMKALAEPAPKESTETAKAVAAVPEAETQPEAPQDTAPPAPEEAPAPQPAQEAAKSAADPHPLGVITLPPSPADLARLRTYKQQLVMAEAAMKAAAKASPPQAGEGKAAKRDFDPNVGGGVDRDKLPARDFAGPHRSYPIDKPGDVSDAAHSLGRAKGGAKERAQIKAKIIAIARRKGKAYVDQLPEAWKDKTSKAEAAKADGRQCPSCKEFSKPTAAECEHCGERMEKAARPKAKAKGKKPWKGDKPFPSAAPPYKKGNDGEGAPRPGPAKKGSAAKSAPCKCGGTLAKDAKFCSACGAPAKGKTAKGKKPFPADAKVDAAISRLEGDADAALDAQAKDPDAKTHPADRKVTAELERVKADVEAAADAQEHDEATDTPEGHAEAAKGTQETEGPAYHLRRLHDALCAAYTAEDVILAHPAAAKGIGGLVDPQAFAAMTQAALTEDGGTGTRARDIPALSAAFQHAVALKAAAAGGTLDEAMEGIRKAFAAYYPDAHPKPGSISPGEFRRPYISAGHANQSAKPSQEPRIPMSSHVPDPSDFRRPLITDGREAASPGSDPRPNGLGKAERKAAKKLAKARTYYTNAGRDSARETLTAMHDWIADNHPGVCPMTGTTYDGEPGKPGSMGSSLSTAKPVPAVMQATRAEAAPRPVDHGEMSRNEGRMGKHKAAKAAGKAGKMPKNAAGKTRKAAPAAPASPLIDPDMLKGLFRESAADLLGDVTKTLGDLTTRIAELESAPDPAQMAPRSGMAAVAKNSAGHEVPAGGDGHEVERLARIVKRAKDPDGGVRVAAIEELIETAGREAAVQLLEAAY